jgi:uncharacterized membrane protein
MEIQGQILLWLHILAAVAWIGGMIFNLFVLRPSMAVVEPAHRVKLAQGVLRRFIPLVWLSIAILTITGAFLALPWDPSYLLLFKLAIFLGMVGIVALIRYYYLPRLEHLITRGSEDAGMLLGKMVVLVKINLSLGVLVLFLSGFLAFNI